MAEQQKSEQKLRDAALDRRTFLRGTAGAAAFLVVQSAFELDAIAQQADQNPGLQFFNPADVPTVEALVERIWPTTDESPGARDAGVLFYIDRALAGRYSQFQLTYRNGLDGLDVVSQQEHNARFAALAPEQQDALLTAIGAGEVVRPPQVEAVEGLEAAAVPVPDEVVQEIAGLAAPTEPGLDAFFDLVRNHTMEGLFADPIYGGNRDFAGWRAVGYPGAHAVYTQDEQQSFEPLNKPFQSIADF